MFEEATFRRYTNISDSLRVKRKTQKPLINNLKLEGIKSIEQNVEIGKLTEYTLAGFQLVHSQAAEIWRDFMDYEKTPDQKHDPHGATTFTLVSEDLCVMATVLSTSD